MTGPITPDQVAEAKAASIPETVYEAVNELIAEKWNGTSAKFRQDDLLVILADKGISRQEAFARHWLDFEEAYREVGWYVTYDKPAYNESYPATFEFRKERL